MNLDDTCGFMLHRSRMMRISEIRLRRRPARNGLIAAVLLVLFVATAGARPVVILDTDMRSDCDDAGALATLHALADLEECEILAVMASTTGSHVVGAIDAINTYYGSPELPVGLIAGSHTRGSDDFAPTLADTGLFPGTQVNADAPDSSMLYRQLLHEAPEQSVTIVVVGGQGAVYQFLQTEANHEGDGIPYTGLELAAAKVRELVLMAGNFENPNHEEFNVRIHLAGAQFIAEEWPGEIVYSGYEIGHPILTGEGLNAFDPEINPVAMAYKLYRGTSGGQGVIGDRNSWDQTAVYYAVRGVEHEGQPIWSVSDRGHVSFSDTGRTEFSPDAGSDRRYLIQEMSVSATGEIIEELMVRPPTSRATIDPVVVDYDLDNPDDATTTITWSEAGAVESVRHDDGALEAGAAADYVVEGDNLIIKKRYLAGRLTEPGSEVVLTIRFDSGASAIFRVRVSIEPAGLVAYYPFSEGSGSVAADHSGFGDPLNLALIGGAVWLTDRDGVWLEGGSARLESGSAAAKLYQQMTATGQFSVEVWGRSEQVIQGGPARLVSYSMDTGNRNFTVGHGDHQNASSDMVVRLRTTATNANGMPDISASDMLIDSAAHYVVTYDGDDVRFYRNSSLMHAEARSGTVANWNSSFPLVLGNENEADGNRGWVGALYEVSIFDTALTASEVEARYTGDPTTPIDTPDPYSYESWFGAFLSGAFSSIQDRGWAFHEEHGWIYVAAATEESFWLSDADLGWLWTDAATYSYLYSYERGSWIWYFRGTVQPRWFIDMTDPSKWFRDSD